MWAAFSPLIGCTSFQVRSQDGAVIYCRSLEFGFPLQSEILIAPRATSYTGTAPDGKSGIKWKVKYGFLGMNQSMAQNFVNDGMNEKGLAVGCLYLPKFAQYEKPDADQNERTLGAWELATYLLSTCATVQDVKAAIPNIIVAQEPTPQLNGFFLPVHFHICDATGASLVIEYVGGERRVHDNPVGVLTNSPPFDWQMNHLMSYVNLSPVNAPNLQLKNYKVQFAGQGSGLLGLPGDYSAPSRFVRAALFSSFATPPKNAIGAVRLGFHLLNTFDVVDGLVRAGGQEERVPAGMRDTEITQWVVVYDQTNRKAYFRTYEGLAIQMVDLKKLDFTEGEGFRQIAVKKEFSFENITDNVRPLQIKD